MKKVNIHTCVFIEVIRDLSPKFRGLQDGYNILYVVEHHDLSMKAKSWADTSNL